MLRLVVTIAAALLAGCTAAPQPAPRAPASAADSADITNTRKLENQWNQCLEQSYRTARKTTPDKNAAAETAFQKCASEEQDLDLFIMTEVHAPSPMPHLKEETKRLLVKEGHLPIYPEQ